MQLLELEKTGIGKTMRTQKQQVTEKAIGLWIRHLVGADQRLRTDLEAQMLNKR